ncbi:unnamed protein product, partial [marine sediment metagenome]
VSFVDGKIYGNVHDKLYSEPQNGLRAKMLSELT